MKVASNKCPRCNKSVYHAERHTLDGKEYHSQCVWEIERERAAAKKPVFDTSAAINCNPGDAAFSDKAQLTYAVCAKCGGGLGAKATTCPQCGTAVPGRAAASTSAAATATATSTATVTATATPTSANKSCCQAAAASNAKFCAECGAKVASAACKKCSVALSPTAKFCAECGERQQ